MRLRIVFCIILGYQDAEGASFRCPDETCLKCSFRNTCWKVKLEFCNRFELKILMGHFFWVTLYIGAELPINWWCLHNQHKPKSANEKKTNTHCLTTHTCAYLGCHDFVKSDWNQVQCSESSVHCRAPVQCTECIAMKRHAWIFFSAKKNGYGLYNGKTVTRQNSAVSDTVLWYGKVA